MKSFKADLEKRELADLSIAVFITSAFTFPPLLLTASGLAFLLDLKKDSVWPLTFILWSAFWIWGLWQLRKIMLRWEESRFNSRIFQTIPIVIFLIFIPRFIFNGWEAWNEWALMTTVFQIAIGGFYLTYFLLLAIIPRWPRWSDLVGVSILMISLILTGTKIG